ncbi:MAG: DegT/DnrJ/EryC1/StrS family aminotransferase [Bacteroidota bacterium]
MSDQYSKKIISATKPFIPPISEYQQKVSEILNRGWLTNQGPCVEELEDKLKDYLKVENLLLVTNGTIAIQLAIKALDLMGEVITTPYSYVATTSSLLWENCVPRFCDIDKDTFNIDPTKIENLITDKTTAILATNVYGYPCDIKAIENIASKYDLKIIFDSAHCFGTNYENKNILNFGDVSTISFHATKLFHTVEGGAVVCRDKAVYERMKLMRNFGHTSPTTFSEIGINAKMNELTAAMGLVNLHYIDEIRKQRKYQWDLYKKLLFERGIYTTDFKLDFNKAYFPFILDSEEQLLSVLKKFEEENIHLRRYFYPSLNELTFIPLNDSCPIAEDISKRVICLPLYHDLKDEEISFIVNKLAELC